MTEMFSMLGTWNWLIFGFVLMALELLAPGVFMFWLGLAALLVGLVSFAISPSWQTQLLMFAVFAVAAVPAWRHFARSEGSRSLSNPFLNNRTKALIGREFTLEKPIVDGTGTVRIDDTIWRVAGPDAPAGSRVRVVQVDGASLTVAAA
ncbi:NfeD family protein [Bradyrhizobium sp. sBnM-33]|uniref:NfeD family protein n=1 Tax=Bradyrhizobium sp. sBnM-33 TaxID=2831780 RepID=UPI001BD14F54|nr:NfeD family protein [Bradyrhizobium sp. sBnM-33]WOH49930.1 NfeD family protein [Bradyrhizobium sp. sBnM-33]